MTCDSGGHAQRGDAKQAPSEGCQSGGATSAASPNLGRGKEDTVEELNCSEEMIEAANERLRTLFAETAILALHPNKDRKALAKERVYAILYAQPARPSAVTVTEEMIQAGALAVDWEVSAHNIRKIITAALSKVSPLVSE